MIQNTDGNLAALRQYDAQQEHQEQAQEFILNNIKPLIDKLTDLVDEIHYYDDWFEGYDFSEFITEEIQDAIR